MRMNRNSRYLLGAAMAVSTCALMAGCSSPDSDQATGPTPADTWRIGVEAPLSGSQATLGRGMLQGAQLAAQEINDNGGVLGKQIELVQIDDAADPETGVRAAQRAINDGLVGVVGPYNSGVGVMTLPQYVDAGLVPVRLTSDNATDGLGITLQPMSSQIAPVTVQALVELFDAKSVAIIYDETQIYNESTSSAVKEGLEAAGVEVTNYLPLKPGAADYSEIVGQATAGNPDVVYSSVYFPEGALIAKALADDTRAASTSGCLLDYSSYDTGYVDDAGVEVAQRCEVVGVPAPGDFAGAAEFVARFEEQFGSPPGTWSPYTYDSLKILVESAELAGGWDPEKLGAQLSSVSDWQGWTGSVSIQAGTGNRDPATVVVTAVDDEGEFHVAANWVDAVGAPY